MRFVGDPAGCLETTDAEQLTNHAEQLTNHAERLSDSNTKSRLIQMRE